MATLKFIYNSLWCRIEGDYPYAVVDKATSYSNPASFFISRYRPQNNWDGRYRLIRKVEGPKGVKGPHFPTGLLYEVRQALEKEFSGLYTFQYEEVGIAPALENNPIQLEGVELRDYQIEAVNIAKEIGRGIWHSSTGSGKTESAIALTQNMGLKTLFLVYGKDLVEQSYQRYRTRLGPWLKRTNRKLVKWMGGKVVPGDIAVASVSTLVSLHKKSPAEFAALVKPFQLLLADEVHQIAAETFYKVGMSIPAYYRLGLSGTPLSRTDGANLKVIAVTGPVIHRISNRDMASKGKLAKTTIEFMPVPEDTVPESPKNLTTWNPADFTEQLEKYGLLYKKCIVNNAYRNQLVCNKTRQFYEQGKSIVVLVREIEHGEKLEADLKAVVGEENALFLHGLNTVPQREQAKQEFRDNKLKVLIASTIFDQGIDLPNIDVLVLASAGKSPIKTLQRLGRGLRGDSLHVVEFADKTDPVFIEQSKKRLAIYKKEKAFTITFAKELLQV